VHARQRYRRDLDRRREAGCCLEGAAPSPGPRGTSPPTKRTFLVLQLIHVPCCRGRIYGSHHRLVVGALVGWLASMIMRTGGGILFDIIIGIAGALIAGFLFGGGASIINAPRNVASILYSLLGAIILLAIVKLLRRSAV
jgi:uncharacterized membrane protein YeaQ/YmgE (transglycosylase-associated protein family)